MNNSTGWRVSASGRVVVSAPASAFAEDPIERRVVSSGSLKGFKRH